MRHYRKIFYYLLCMLILLINIKVKAKDYDNQYKLTTKQDILCIMLGYPDFVSGVEVNENGLIFIKMKSGNKILYDDKRVKGVEEKINNPDIQDTMEQIYPLSFPKNLMAKNFDPGRCRNYALLKEVYGFTNAKVEGSLKNVKVGYSTLQFNKNNRAAEELSSVMKELIPLTSSRSDIRGVLFPTSGTFNYRYISGTNRLSPHAFGIAIDLASNKNDYWKWAAAKEGEKRLLLYPKDVVEAFERHNFIWGGKWNHFDILHFEYRPEIILKARYFSNNVNSLKSWHDGVTFQEKDVETKIKEIDGIIR